MKIFHRISFLLLFVFAFVGMTGCSIQMPASTSGFATATLPARATDSLAGISKPDAANAPAWAGLGLSGKLIYTSSQPEGTTFSMDIHQLDLVTGENKQLFHTDPGGTLYAVAVSPDHTQMILSYSLPPGVDQSPHQWLYQMPLDASSAPVLLFTPPTPDDQYLNPEFSPDGKFLYFAHVNYQRPTQKGQHFPFYELYRMAYPGGQPQKLVEQAYWPRISPDMSHLAYITLDPITGKNKPFLANLDGSAPVELSLTGSVPLDIIDAPLFSPDGASLLFSVPVPENAYQPASPTWVEKIFGVSIASAHAVPSDWWLVPLTGGAATQLTQIQAIGLYGSVSPDKKTIASYSGSGIFVMNPDGTGLTMLINEIGGLPGTVSWIP